MGAFCTKCGGKLDAGTRFCSSCGHANAAEAASPAPVATAAAPARAAAAAPAPASGGGSAAKIIFAILGVFTFLVLAGFAGCFYVGYRIKQRANEFSQNMGMNAKAYQGRRDPCRLVTKDEVATAFRTPVVSVENSGNVCTYNFGGTRAMAVDVTWEGGTLTMKLAHGAMKNMVAGMETFTPVAGVGDETYVEPMGSGVMMRKGDVMVNIDLRTAGQNAEAGKQIAALIAGRLSTSP